MSKMEDFKFQDSIEIMKRIYHVDMAGKIKPDDIEKVFACLEEGEKYKQICGDIESLMELDQSSLYRDQMKFIKQKYFPLAKKIMIVEIEGENEDLVKNGFNFLKAFLERNKDGFNCKYKIKEGD